jgi:branched-chain amino acid transport system substrate-binding protein
MKVFKTIICISLVSLIFFCLSVPLFAATSTTELKTVKVGIVGPFTGPSALLSTFLYGAAARFQYINDNGGQGGYKFEFILRDDEGVPTKCVNVVNELIYKEKVSVLIGPPNSSNVLAILPMVFQAKIPMLLTSATSNMITEEAQKLAKESGGKDYIYRIMFKNSVQGLRLIKFVKDHNYKKPAILVDTTAYGKDGGKMLITELEKLGIKPALYQEFTPNSADLSPNILKAKEAGADVILAWALGPDLAQLAKARKKLGFEVPFVACASICNADFRDLAKEAGQGGLTANMGFLFLKDTELSQKTKDAYSVYKKYYPNGYELNEFYVGVLNWDAAGIIAEAVSKVGTDGEKIRDYIENTEFTNLITKDKQKFSSDNHEMFRVDDLVMVEVWENRIRPREDL